MAYYEPIPSSYKPPINLATKPRPPNRRLKILQDHHVQFYMTHGYLKAENCFSRSQAEQLMGDLWQRMGVTPDKSTWVSERIDIHPSRDGFKVEDFAPKAWAVICDLMGGEDRLDDGHWWDDSFIVNLGTPEGEGKVVAGMDLDGWHVDGDFFVHYLDSPEQGLLILPLFTDIQPGGGGTMLCPAALQDIAQYLYDHPEGVSPDLEPRGGNPNWKYDASRWWIDDIIKRQPADSFVEATGKAGDVYFLHPFMAHSFTNNARRDLRVINNPNVSLKEPFNFNRRDGDYSIVELTTRDLVGAERLRHWRVRGPREKVLSHAEREAKPGS